MAIGIKRYSGSAWVNAVVKRYNGSAWVDAVVNKRTASAWEQIYPDVAVSTTQTITGSSTLWTYRASTYKNWKQEDAKQGNGSSYGGDSNNYGYLNLSSSKFTGHKNINSLSSAYFTGKRGGAGAYSTNQVINFVRGNVTASTSAASPQGTLSGRWYCNTNGPGSGGTMSNKQMYDGSNGTKPANCLSWMNAVDSKPQLYIYKSGADYLSITGAVSVKATYVYMSRALAFDAIDSYGVPYMSDSKIRSYCGTTTCMSPSLVNSDAYHTMIIYPEEEGMTLQEIIEYRTENNLSDIRDDNVLLDYERKVMLRDATLKHETNTIEVKLDYLREGHIPEYSIDGYNFNTLKSENVDVYTGDLTSEFDRNRNFVYIRVRNEKTDSIDLEYVHEPAFLVL